MDIRRVGCQPSGKGSAEWFTGTVRVDPLFTVHDPARASGSSVTFELGARLARRPPGSARAQPGTPTRWARP